MQSLRQSWHSENPIVGVAMDRAFHVDQHSIFEYCLGWALAPLANKPHQEFIKAWACILAQPQLYHEAMCQWDADHPNQSFTEVTGTTIDIKHLSSDEPTFSTTVVMDHAICNHIPLLWVDHGYTFGLHFLGQYLMMPSSPYEKSFALANRHCLDQLANHNLPLAIPGWNGSWSPHEHDLIHVHALMHLDEQNHAHYCLMSSEWLNAGANPSFTQLLGHDWPHWVLIDARSHQRYSQPHITTRVLTPCCQWNHFQAGWWGLLSWWGEWGDFLTHVIFSFVYYLVMMVSHPSFRFLLGIWKGGV